ncbi:hypothetical protein UFOVP1165_43 [uncultured Caudovirales phage]|uniref:Uncharacterized protein n=1 Tax=uncultured Caudovirales phage TaxID=2100421 RepID=A0A6J5QUC2_9CAUD|nr:hypothetical protein UFOVP1165_43 [uncultured Caudovirales phage]
MDQLSSIFNTLAEAFGPVGALFVIIAGFLLRRLFSIQDKQMDSAVADAKLQTDLKNAFDNMRTAFDSVVLEFRARK